SALRAVAHGAAALVHKIEQNVRDVVQTLRDVANDVAGAAEALARKVAEGAVAVFNAVVAAGKYLIEHLTSCPQPPPVKHPKGSGNLVMAVGGLGSSRHATPSGRLSPSFHLEWKAFGYEHD